MPTLRENVLRTRWLELSDRLKDADLGGLLLTHAADVQWLTGYSGSNGAALALVDSRPLLATDSRYSEHAARDCPEAELVITRDLVGQLLMRLREHNVTRLGVDPASLTLAEFRMMSAHPAIFGVAIQEVETPLRNLRQAKDLHERESLAQACAISTQALADTLEYVTVGKSERDVARFLEYRFAAHGGEDRAFPTIVAAGANGDKPHHIPTDRSIEAGDLVTIDFGAMVDGYHADCTRTVIVGAEPEDWQAEIYQCVQEAADIGRQAAGPGVPAAVVDAAARHVISDAGYGEYFLHGTGHGVGLSIHEAPAISSASTDSLGVHVPFTVEPGIYIPNQGGVRIEDTCMLTTDGLEILTDFSRDLIRVD